MIFKSYQTDSNITFSLNKTYLKNLRSKMLPKTKTGLFASAIKKVHELSMVKNFKFLKIHVYIDVAAYSWNSDNI